jgi:hypothetical protein
MKLGNVSQSIIPVPKFFLNRRSLDLFTSYYQTQKNTPRSNSKKNKKSKKNKITNGRNKSYYRTKDILSLNCDININLNPRSLDRNSTAENKKRYIPLYHRSNYQNNAEIKETFFPDIIDMNNPNKTNETPGKQSALQPYKEYKKKTNIEQLVNPDLRKDIMHNTQNLLERININYDLKKWSDFDSRTTLNRFHQTAYSPITDVIQNNLSDKDAFSSTLRQKALTLKTISSKAKDAINKVLYQTEFDKRMKECEEKINNENTDILLKNNRNNFLRLRYNNCDAPQYNEKDKLFISENQRTTKRLNRTKMYKEFPSSIKEEFKEKKFFKNKEQLKLTEFNNTRGFITKEKYGYKNLNCNGDEFTSCLSPMWKRPLHEDAFK